MRQKAFDRIRFHGTFRAYQKDILERAESYLDDEKLHIVAAPGSGKTILGLELIRKIGRPALVLAPTVTVRDQWGDRFRDFFLEEGEDAADYVSYSLHEPGLLTVITYQALYAAMKKLRYEEELSEKAGNLGHFGRVTEDYAAFDVTEAVRAAGIETICLDEAHHLKREWWVSLQEFMERTGRGMRTISLTATPPYDSSPGEWARYISVCGEIDDEITVPELVREGVLCPHQDYLLFNRTDVPVERRMLEKLGNILKIVHTEWVALKGRLRMVILTDYIHKEALQAVGTGEEIDSIGAVPVFEMIRRSFASGEPDEPGAAVQTGSVLIVRTELIPELSYRTGREIAGQPILGRRMPERQKEMQTDAEMREDMPSDRGRAAQETVDGVSPVAEQLMEEETYDTGYSLITSAVPLGDMVRVVTSLFEDGLIPVLIGTKSLLGEGWDAPSVNSLVLASFVGSIVSSNQMRGRAIRTCRSDQGKVSNIWHLTDASGSVFPSREGAKSELETMVLRFRCFMGPSYDGETIEDGIARLRLPDVESEEEIAALNREMLLRAADREAVASAWKAAMDESGAYGTARALDVIRIPADHVPANRILGLSLPGRKAKTLRLAAEAVLQTLKSMELIVSPGVRVEVALSRREDEYRCAILGATSREESVFAAAFYEMFVPGGRPRYVLVPEKGALRGLFGTNASFLCPAVIGTNKKQALYLAAKMRPLGAYLAVYTGGVRGEEIYEAIRRGGTMPPSDSIRRLRMLL